MKKKKVLKKYFIPVPAYFTFWYSKTGYSKKGHNHRTITEEEIDLHLQGKQGLVVSPFIDDENVIFGVIDIDINDLDLVRTIVQRLETLSLRPNLFRSKSKGFHIYIFSEEPLPARKMLYNLRKVVTDDIARNDKKLIVEIFPKQEKITEKGGNKVNLPLFGDDREQLLLNGESKKETHITTSDLQYFLAPPERQRVELRSDSVTEHENIYPCIERVLKGVKKGSRNVSCFHLARFWVSVGYRLADISTLIENWNLKNQPPLSKEELQNIVNSIKEGKSKGAPDCDNPIIQQFCDKEHCRRAEIIISEDPLIIRKYDGYYIEKKNKNVKKRNVRATNFVMDIVEADSGTGDVSLRVKKGEEQITVNLSNDKPGWSDFLSACNYKGVTCDYFEKFRFIILLGAELSRVKDKIGHTDIAKMEFEKILAMIEEDQITRNEADVELQKEELHSGWKDNDAIYFRSGPFCAKHRIGTRELARILKKNGIKKMKVRAPIKEQTPLDVWVIKHKKDNEDTLLKDEE